MFNEHTSITFKQLLQYIKENNIPENVKLLSDSGWECGETGIRAVYYNEFENVLFLYQDKERDIYTNDIEDIQKRDATQLLSDGFTWKENYYFKDR